MKLYRVTIKARPSANHPRFFDIQFCYLHIWVYGHDPDDAAERATDIFKVLPYERAEKEEQWNESFRVSVRLAGRSKIPEFKEKEESAKIIGVAFFTHELVTGADDSGLDESDPP